MPQKKINSLFVKFFLALTLLTFSYSAYSFCDTPKSLSNKQHQVYLHCTEADSLNSNFQKENSSFFDCFPEGEKQAITGTSTVYTKHSATKNQKQTSVDSQKFEETNRFLTVSSDKTNCYICFANFDNLAGFLIQKQLKTNA